MRVLRFTLSNAALASALFLITSSLSAQTIVSDIPPEYEEPVDVWITASLKEDSPFFKGRFSEGVTAQKIKQGQILRVANNMISMFKERDWGDNEHRQQKILNRLQLFKTAMKVALNTQGIEGALDQKSEQNIFLKTLNREEFGLHTLGMETLIDSSGNDVHGYFANTDDKLLLYEYLEDGERVRLLLSPEQVTEWRLLEDALSNLIQEQVFLVSASNIKALQTSVARWENFMDRGYSQMPWESKINGWLIKTREFPELGPPDHQFIFMHPTLGFEMSTGSVDETRVKEVLHIELLGHIWYRGYQLEQFRGLSLTASLREDLDPGIGLMYHIKRNWSVGVSWHDIDADPFLFFSVDLFKFAKQYPTQYVEKYAAESNRLMLP